MSVVAIHYIETFGSLLGDGVDVIHSNLLANMWPGTRATGNALMVESLIQDLMYFW
jgi:hypothetical protein